jgi:flagellar export protein FliJ
MKRFVFRAAAALELRRRQYDEAQRDLAGAEAGRMTALQQLEDAREKLSGMLEHGQREEERVGDLTMRLWYRNWIAGQRSQVERCRVVLTRREREVKDATERALVAHRKRKALERFHDRALATWQDAARREEQKVIDELASTRYARRRAGGEQ